MKQLARSLYLVKQNEVVTVAIIATKVGNTAVFAVSDTVATELPPPRTYRFVVTLVPGRTHFGVVKCEFADDTPPDAFFQVTVSGLDDNGKPVKFEGPHISKEDPLTCVLQFEVEAAS